MPYNEVMHKWKHGQLHSGSKSGPTVTSRQQAIAIMLSEKRKAGSKPEYRKRMFGGGIAGNMLFGGFGGGSETAKGANINWGNVLYYGPGAGDKHWGGNMDRWGNPLDLGSYALSPGTRGYNSRMADGSWIRTGVPNRPGTFEVFVPRGYTKQQALDMARQKYMTSLGGPMKRFKEGHGLLGMAIRAFGHKNKPGPVAQAIAGKNNFQGWDAGRTQGGEGGGQWAGWDQGRFDPNAQGWQPQPVGQGQVGLNVNSANSAAFANAPGAPFQGAFTGEMPGTVYSMGGTTFEKSQTNPGQYVITSGPNAGQYVSKLPSGGAWGSQGGGGGGEGQHLGADAWHGGGGYDPAQWGGANTLSFIGGAGNPNLPAGGSYFAKSGFGLPNFMPSNVGGGGPANVGALGKMPVIAHYNWGPGTSLRDALGSEQWLRGNTGMTAYSPEERQWLNRGQYGRGGGGPGMRFTSMGGSRHSGVRQGQARGGIIKPAKRPLKTYGKDTVPVAAKPGEMFLTEDQQQGVMPKPGMEHKLRPEQLAKLYRPRMPMLYGGVTPMPPTPGIQTGFGQKPMPPIYPPNMPPGITGGGGYGGGPMPPTLLPPTPAGVDPTGSGLTDPYTAGPVPGGIPDPITGGRLRPMPPVPGGVPDPITGAPRPYTSGGAQNVYPGGLRPYTSGAPGRASGDPRAALGVGRPGAVPNFAWQSSPLAQAMMKAQGAHNAHVGSQINPALFGRKLPVR